MPHDHDHSPDYPLGGLIEPHDMERERKDLTLGSMNDLAARNALDDTHVVDDMYVDASVYESIQSINRRAILRSIVKTLLSIASIIILIQILF